MDAPARTDLVPTLTDGVITLRAHSTADVDALVEQCTDPDTLQWTTVPRGYTRDDAAGFVQHAATQWADPSGSRMWAIEWVDDSSGEPTPRYGGTVDLRPGESPLTASLGFALHPAARGTGTMARAVRLAATCAFEAGPWGRPLERIHWRAIVGNWGSRRVAWATGFAFHATLPGTHVNPADREGPGLDSWYASLARGDQMTPKTPWFTAPVIEEDGLRLRVWRPDDIDAIEERTDPEHWMPAHAVLRPEMFPRWRHRRLELMAEGMAVDWCVADADTDRALGGVAVFSRMGPMTGDSAELGYQLFPSARGRGVAKTAARLAIRHALTPKEAGGLGLRRLVAETAADNAASNRVLEANGFVAFGREHHVDLLADGTYQDGLHWELLPTGGDRG